MEEEIKKLITQYKQLAEKLTAKWPEGLEKVKGKDYVIAAKDLATACILEVVAVDLNKIIEAEADDRK